jgi:hypothetical protein
VLAGAPQPVGAVVDHVDIEALRGQPPGERPGQMDLVLDHENPHETESGRRMARRLLGT